jgi:hypothetical protein
MWIEEALEITMDVVEKMTHSLKRANKMWNIILNSIFDHLNGKTMKPRGVLTQKEDAKMIKWTLAM